MLNERRTTRHHSNLRVENNVPRDRALLICLSISSFFSVFFLFFFFFRTLESACPSKESIIFSFSEQVFVNPFGNEEYRAAATRKWLISGLMTCRRLMDTYGFWFRFNYAKIFRFEEKYNL